MRLRVKGPAGTGTAVQCVCGLVEGGHVWTGVDTAVCPWGTWGGAPTVWGGTDQNLLVPELGLYVAACWSVRIRIRKNNEME